MKKVSLIIPTYQSEDFIEECLESIQKQTYSDCEIIVVDNFSKDSTLEIAKKFTSNTYQIGPERSAQRNYGAQKAQGEFLFFIDSDMKLSASLVEECVKIMEEEQIQGIKIPEISFGSTFWQKAKCLEREFYRGVPWMEGARFFRKSAFQAVHGYDERFRGVEDFDLSQRVEHQFGKKSLSSSFGFIYHNEKNTSFLGSCMKKFQYTQNLPLYYNSDVNQKYFFQQASLWRRYFLFFSQPKKLLKNPLLSLGMLFFKTSEFFFGGMGLVCEKLRRSR